MATQKNKSILLRLITKVKAIANQIKQINADITGLKSSGGGVSSSKSWKTIYTPPMMGSTNIDKLRELPLSIQGTMVRVTYTFSGVDTTQYEFIGPLSISLIHAGNTIGSVDSGTRLYVTDDAHIRFFELIGVYDTANSLSLWDMYEYDLNFELSAGTGGTGGIFGGGMMGTGGTMTGVSTSTGMTVSPSKNTYNIVKVDLYY